MGRSRRRTAAHGLLVPRRVSTPVSSTALGVDELVALLLVGGVPHGAGGYAILPGGHRVPVPPRSERAVHAATADVMRGMALAELAGRLVDDGPLRRRAEEIGLEIERKRPRAVERSFVTASVRSRVDVLRVRTG